MKNFMCVLNIVVLGVMNHVVLAEDGKMVMKIMEENVLKQLLNKQDHE